jgi:hypothetical protein
VRGPSPRYPLLPAPRVSPLPALASSTRHQNRQEGPVGDGWGLGAGGLFVRSPHVRAERISGLPTTNSEQLLTAAKTRSQPRAEIPESKEGGPANLNVIWTRLQQQHYSQRVSFVARLRM